MDKGSEGNTIPSIIISLAEKALYESKNNGHDRVTLKLNPFFLAEAGIAKKLQLLLMKTYKGHLHRLKFNLSSKNKNS